MEMQIRRDLGRSTHLQDDLIRHLQGQVNIFIMNHMQHPTAPTQFGQVQGPIPATATATATDHARYGVTNVEGGRTLTQLIPANHDQVMMPPPPAPRSDENDGLLLPLDHGLGDVTRQFDFDSM